MIVCEKSQIIGKLQDLGGFGGPALHPSKSKHFVFFIAANITNKVQKEPPSLKDTYHIFDKAMECMPLFHVPSYVKCLGLS